MIKFLIGLYILIGVIIICLRSINIANKYSKELDKEKLMLNINVKNILITMLGFIIWPIKFVESYLYEKEFVEYYEKTKETETKETE